MKLLGKGEHRFPPVDKSERYIILDDYTKPIIEEQLSGTIMSLSGHTTDSIGLLLEDGSLFCGDAAMNSFPSLNRITIWIENLEDYRRSWEAMLNLEPSMIYPSHGKPFKKEDLKKNMHKLGELKLYPLK
ncbi:MBL fold metallo-hydrolase [Tepidimicrobium xylanilyticum]